MAHRSRSRAFSLLALALSATMLVSGCGNDEKKSADKTPAQVMEAAKKHFDEASSVHIALSTTSTPPEGNGVLGATGDVAVRARAIVSVCTRTVSVIALSTATSAAAMYP